MSGHEADPSGGKRQTPGEDRVYEEMARALDVPFIDLREQYISAGMLRKVPTRLANSRRWIPLIFNPRRVILIVDDLFAACAWEEGEMYRLLGLTSRREFGFALASPSAMDAFLEEKYPPVGVGPTL